MGSGEAAAAISFGPYLLDGDNARLLRAGRPVSLTPKALDVLHYLATRPGRLVTKNELLSAVWPDVIVGDASIKVCVREIRKALEDGARRPTYIETVHRRGYRFIAELRPNDSPYALSAVDCDLPPTHPVIAVGAAPTKLLPPIVGRENELRHLIELFDRSRDCQRQCVFVCGGAGSGKTALVENFSRLLSESAAASPLVLVGHCFEQFGTSEPYLPVWEAVSGLARERPASLSGMSSRYTTPGYPSAPPVGDMLLAPPATSDRLLRGLADAMEHVSQETPLVLVLEDVQWADYCTIDLISALARRRSPARVMVIATYRPVEILSPEHPLRGIIRGLLTADLAEELCLGCLGEDAVGRFLDARFPMAQFPNELVNRLHQRTDGHPLFLVELVNDLVELGVLAEREGRWQLSGAARGEESDGAVPAWLAVLDTQVPQTVRDMIEVHLSRLDPESRRVLESAAAVGMEFSAAAVAAAADSDVVRAEQVCDELARRHRFLEPHGHVEWPDGTVATHYRFAHELYHSVVYEQIPIARRTRLHQQVGLRLESAWCQRTAEEAAGLAFHFEAARDWHRAVKYLRQAAQAASRQYAHRESARYLGRALDAVERLDPGDRACHELDVLKALGVNLQVTRGFAAPEVEAIHARAYALCHAGGGAGKEHVEKTFPVLWAIWLFHKVRSDLHRAREMAHELLSLAGADPSLLLQAHQAMSVTHLCLGEPQVAADHMERAAAMYNPALHARNTQTFGQDPGVATLAFGAIALWLLGREHDSLSASERSLELARQLRQPSSLALGLHFAAMLHQLRGDPARTEQCAAEAVAIATEEGFSFWRAGGTVLRGWARVAGLEHQSTSDPESGIDDIRRGLDAWLETGSRTYHTYFLGLLSDALLRLGRADEALPLLEDAIAAARSLPEGLYAAELHRLKGQCILKRRDASSGSEAQDAFAMALSVARSQPATTFELKAAADLAAISNA